MLRKITFGTHMMRCGMAAGLSFSVSAKMMNTMYTVAVIKLRAKPEEVSRRCAVTPSGIPTSAKVKQASEKL